MSDTESSLRVALVETCVGMQQKRLCKGTSGNVSVRVEDGFLISPTGVPYEKLLPKHVVRMRFDGSFDGDMLPSSEWRFHCDILKTRDDVNAVVHTHSPDATAVSIMERDIPPIHYQIASAGGINIRCAGYATFGTQELADMALVALEGRKACLLAHHGVIAAHVTLPRALYLAEVVEELSGLYLRCLPMGEPPLISDEAIAVVLDKYRTYGQQKKSS